MPVATLTLAAVGSTAVTPVTNDMVQTRFIAPSVLCTLTNGAVMTYTVQVTGDNVSAPGYTAASGTWATLDTMGALTASANATLGGRINGIRATVSAYTSGTLTFQFVWSSDLRT